MSTPTPIVRAADVRMSFSGQEVLKGVTLELFGGEVHAIVGENGAGKSTLAKIIAGVYQPTSGQVELRGAPVRLSGPREAIQLGIGLIHQEPLIFPDLDVAENIFVGHQPGVFGWIDRAQMHGRAAEILARIGANFTPSDTVATLSIADRQMVELASALSYDARVLILDETTASLTPKETAELFEVVRKLRHDGCAIGFVSHRLEEVFSIAHRITVLRDGQKVAERYPGDSTPNEIVQLMVGREIPDRDPTEHVNPIHGDLLRVTGLSNNVTVKGVSFEVQTGEIVGMAGLVGAGRTEVCRMIFGIDKMTEGQIFVNGKPVDVKSPREAMKLGIAMVPEDRQHAGLFMPMSIGENATMANLKRFSAAGWLKFQPEKESAKEYVQRLRTVCRTLEQPVRELSGGNQQKVVLAKWLMTQPKLLILDEPTRGVDVGAKDEIHRIIRELVATGLGILMVSSDLPELLALSDRVVVMHQGRLTVTYAREQATEERIMRAAAGQVAFAG